MDDLWTIIGVLAILWGLEGLICGLCRCDCDDHSDGD